MPTLRQYLEELIRQRNDLADNLVTQSVPALQTEKLNTLVPKVLDIQGGGGSPYLEPLEYDWNIGYVDSGTWKYENPTRTYIDIYRVEAGRRYFLFVGKTPGTRMRIMFTVTDIRGMTVNVIGTNILNVNNPAAYRSVVFNCEHNGYVLFAKDNIGTSGLKSYVLDYTDGGSGGSVELIEKIITANGVYVAEDDSADGYSKVTVDVGGPSFAINGNSSFMYEDGWIGPFADGQKYIVPVLNGQIVKPDWRQPFEINVAFKVSGSVSRSQVLFGAQQDYFYCPSIELSSGLSGIWCGFSTTGYNWNYSCMFSASEFPISTGVEITIHAEWDGTTYTVTVSNGEITLTKSIIPSGTHYFNTNYNLEFGGISTSSNHNAAYVKIDLRKTYLKQNGVLVWGMGG